MKNTLGLLTSVLLLGAVLSGCSVPANTVHSKEDLVGKKIACQRGTTGYIYASEIENADVEGYSKGADAIQALVKGKADAVIIDSEPAKVFVSENPSLTILSDPFAKEEYAIAYKKGNDELGRKLNEALTELKSDGTLKTIIGHWIGDSADQVSYTSPEDIAHDNGKLVMVTNTEFPPYESIVGGEVVGIDADMMHAVCDKLGMELVIEDMEFDSIIPAVDSGKADVGVAAMTVTEERLKTVSFSQSYAAATQVIVTRAD